MRSLYEFEVLIFGIQAQGDPGARSAVDSKEDAHADYEVRRRGFCLPGGSTAFPRLSTRKTTERAISSGEMISEGLISGRPGRVWMCCRGNGFHSL